MSNPNNNKSNINKPFVKETSINKSFSENPSNIEGDRSKISEQERSFIKKTNQPIKSKVSEGNSKVEKLETPYNYEEQREFINQQKGSSKFKVTPPNSSSVKTPNQQQYRYQKTPFPNNSSEIKKRIQTLKSQKEQDRLEFEKQMIKKKQQQIKSTVKHKAQMNNEDQRERFDFIQKKQKEFQENYRSAIRDSEAVNYKKSKIKSQIKLEEDRIFFKLNICRDRKFKIVENQKQREQLKKTQQNSGIEEIDIGRLLESNRAWEQIDQINKLDPVGQTTNMVYRQILQTRRPEIDIKQDYQTREFVQKEMKKNPESNIKIIKAVESFLKDISDEIDVSFCSKSDLQSQVSVKVISTGFTLNKVLCTQKIEDGETKWQFQDLMDSPKELEKFEDWYKAHLQKQYGIDGKQVRITSVSKGSINVEWEIFDPALVAGNDKARKKIKLHPYFNHFKLCPQDFDPKGNIEFNDVKSDVEFRGNWPYYQPQKCKRYGLSVLKKFDNGNNRWLTMNNSPGEWPVAYHGVNYPGGLASGSNKKVLENIFQGKNKGQMLIAGGGQAYGRHTSLNRKTVIGNGIYCTPHFKDALGYTQPVTVDGKIYELVFQCRVDPKKTHISPKQQYWIVNQPSDIRPYGIILIEDAVKQSYPTPEVQFKEKFTYAKYKDRIQQTMK